MRKILLITIIMLCAPSVWAQYIWVSQDNNSHYVDIEYHGSTSELISLKEKHKPALEYVGQLLTMYRDKIKSKEWSIWVESYVREDGNSVAENRLGAKALSNTIKSYLISNYKVSESDFVTRNYSGTISTRQPVATIVIGMRYPMEKILPDQLIDWEDSELARQVNTAQTNTNQANMISAITPVGVNFNDLATIIPGVDTSKILSPYFEPVTFAYKAPAPKLLEVKDSKASGSDSEIQVEGSLVAAQNALQDSLNSPTYTPPSAANQRRESQRQAKLNTERRGAKHKRDRGFDFGSVEIVSAGAASAIAGAGSSSATINAVGSSLSASDHQRVIEEQLKAQNVANKEGASSKENSQSASKPYAPNPSLAAFAPALSSGAPVTHVAPSFSESVSDNKTRLKKTKKVDFVPQVTVDAQGRMSIDATGFERSLNVENNIRQESAKQEMRNAEQRVFREQVANQRMAKYRAVQGAKGRFAVFGVGVNALTTLAAIPSMQLDVYFSDRFSAIVEGYYSKWSYIPEHKFDISMISPELRFFPMGKRKAFSGLYVGLYGSYGHYNMRGNSRTGYQNDFFSAGLSLGYVLPLGQSGFYLEAGLSAGYISHWGDQYMLHHGSNYSIDSYNRTDNFYPTKIKVSFVYRIFNQKKNFEREND